MKPGLRRYIKKIKKGPLHWDENKILMPFQMEDILVYVNWIIYPSMDNRESESLSHLRNWIQSSRGI